MRIPTLHKFGAIFAIKQLEIDLYLYA